MDRDAILRKCLDDFERDNFPKIRPDPKYADEDLVIAEKKEMLAAGERFRVNEHSPPVVQACYAGLYKHFLRAFHCADIKNLNTYFVGESRHSLLHIILFGRRRLIEDKLPVDVFDHIKISQYLLDQNLFVDIQSRWGYSVCIFALSSFHVC